MQINLIQDIQNEHILPHPSAAQLFPPLHFLLLPLTATSLSFIVSAGSTTRSFTYFMNRIPGFVVSFQ